MHGGWVAGTAAGVIVGGPYASLDEAARRVARDLGLKPGATFWLGKLEPFDANVDPRAVVRQVMRDARRRDVFGAPDFLVGVKADQLGVLWSTLQIAFDTWLDISGFARPLYRIGEVTASVYLPPR